MLMCKSYKLWNHIRLFLTNDISHPILTPKTAIFGFIGLVLIFKLHVNKNREIGTLELSRLINEIKKVKLGKKKLAQNYVRKL